MAQVKFMWALEQKPKTLKQFQKIIHTNYVGEISE